MKTCKNCQSRFEGKYCNQCGQKFYTDKDKSVSSLVGESVHFLTHFEGSFFNSLRAVLFRPGKLSAEYSNGIRKKYFKPISFYLMIIILYLIFPLFQGLNMEMRYYKNLEISGNFIERQIDEKLKEDKINEADLAEKFHEVSAKVSKILLLIFIPFTAMFLYFLYFNKKRFMFDNFILATEFNIFYLLVFYLIFPLIYYLIIDWTGFYTTERILGFVILSGFWIYAFIILKYIMKEKWWLTLIKSLVLIFLHSYFVMVIYKFFVFETTFFLMNYFH
ncbi:MAG: DUF3667 domain-containing protein [Moheibacter sp.]